MTILLTDLAVIVITKAKPSSLEKSFLHQQVPGRFECKSFILYHSLDTTLNGLKIFCILKVYCIKFFFACLKACLKWSLIQYKLDYVPDYFNKIPGRISKPWWIKFCVILPAT